VKPAGDVSRWNLSGATVATVGRLRLLPRWRLAAELARRGGALTNRLSKAQGVVIGYGAASRLESVVTALAEAERRGLWQTSEQRLRRALGLVELPAAAPRTLDADTLARQSGLAPDAVRLLELFDILGGDDGWFDFQDLVAARQARRLLSAGASLSAVIGAVFTARERGVDNPLVRSQFHFSPDGALALSVGGYLAELDGQMRLPLGDAGNPSLDLLYDEAARAEEETRWPEAEAIYRHIISIAPRDAVAHFNLGNVLSATGDASRAIQALARAVALDPRFAEGWYNLAHLHERRDDAQEARQCLERAVAADGRFADAIYNLARLYLAAEEAELAAPLFERYLALDASSAWAERARQGLQLCRMLRQAPEQR
jgi:tetratricopeptide (TPR) repeat protein